MQNGTDKNRLHNSADMRGGMGNKRRSDSAADIFGGRQSITLIAMLADCERWSKHKSEKLDMLFDVFAMVDSDVEWNSYGGFELLLRDQSGYARVTYYEIDSPIPRLKRGDWVRIGATMRPWGLQATSIENTTPAAFMHGLREKITDSRLALKRRLEEMGIKSANL